MGVTIYVKIAKKGWKGSVTSIPSVMRDCGMVSLQFVWIFLAKKPKEKIFINNYIKGGRLSRKRKSFKWEFSLYTYTTHSCKKRADAVCAIFKLAVLIFARVHASTAFLHFAVRIDIYDEPF